MKNLFVATLLLCATAMYSQRSFEYVTAVISSDTASAKEYVIEKVFGQHHVVLLLQESYGYRMKTFVITGDSTMEYNYIALDECEQTILSGETPWFDYFLGADGTWEMTEVWSGISQNTVPGNTRVYINWVVIRHKGIGFNYPEPVIIENTPGDSGVRSIIEFYNPK